MGNSTILSFFDAIKYSKDLCLVLKFAYENYILELVNMPEVIQEGEVHTIFELKKIISDKLYGFSTFKNPLFVNVEFLNGTLPQQKTIAISLSPHDVVVDTDTQVYNWHNISFLPITDTPNPYLKNILLFEAYHNNKKK